VNAKRIGDLEYAEMAQARIDYLNNGMREELRTEFKRIMRVYEEFVSETNTPEHQKHNPFLVAWTTKDVIDNHGGFWGPNHDVFSNWLFEMLNVLDSCNEQEAGCVPNQQIHQ